MLSAEQSFDLVVKDVNRAPVVNVAVVNPQPTDEGQAFSYQLPVNAFIDLDGNALSYSATLADGSTLPSWLVFNAATQTL